MLSQKRALPLATLILLVVLLSVSWELIAWLSPSSHLFIATPSSSLDYTLTHAAQLAQASAVTGSEAVAGLALAFLASLLTFVLLTLFPAARAILVAPIIVSQVVPLITLAPVFVITLGPGLVSKVVMAALISYFPVVVAFLRSLEATPAPMVDFISLYHPRWAFRFFSIHLPLSVPMLMSSLRVSATLALVGALVAEMTGARLGLGKNLFLATRRLEPELLMSSTILVCVLGGLNYCIALLIEESLRRRHLLAHSSH